MSSDPINIPVDPIPAEAPNDDIAGRQKRRLGTWWRAFRWAADNLVTIGGAAAVVAAIIASSGWAYHKLRSELTSYIDAKVEPYDNLLTGMVLVQNADYDIALPFIRRALDAFDRKDTFDDRLRATVDYYLIAVMNTRNFSQHRHDMERIKQFIGKRTSEIAWHQYQFGWFALLTSDLEEAEKRLQIALREARKERNMYSQASAAWALALLRVCTGREADALNYASEASKASFNQFNALRLHVEAETYRQEHQIDQLSNICGKPFKDTFPSFINKFIESGRAELMSILKLTPPSSLAAGSDAPPKDR